MEALHLQAMEPKDGSENKLKELAMEFEKLNAKRTAIENEQMTLQEMREVV